MKQQQELVVITKTYDLILWTCNHTSRFPRNQRYVLGERIERGLYDLLETLIAAKYARQRKELLERANLGLEILRFQMRLVGSESPEVTVAGSLQRQPSLCYASPKPLSFQDA
jgi:hypothetical protein